MQLYFLLYGLHLLLELIVDISLLEETLCSLNLLCLSFQFLALAKQSHRLYFQKLGDLGSIRGSPKLRSVQKLYDQGDG